MLNAIIDWSLNHRVLVIAITLIVVGTGIESLRRLPIDAYPDTTPVMVQINTTAASLAPLEIEQQVTFPVEQVISGLPGLTEVRSVSKFGLSVVTAIFEDGVGLYLARQMVLERLQSTKLPDGIGTPELGPISTGLGEVFHYIVSGDGHSLEELTTLHDWVIRPQLRSVPGVAEVNTWGGEKRQYQVVVEPARLMKYDLVIDDVYDALRRNNMNVGGGNVARGGELQLVQGVSLTTNADEIADIVIEARDGVPVRIRDVAAVRIGHEVRRGAATAQGGGEVVLGLGFMLMGENSHVVTAALRERLEEVKRTLPPGVDVRPVYERTELVDEVIDTVQENLFIGAILVVAILFTFLGSLRAGLIVALAIPLSMLCAFSGMLQIGIAASLMSLGAIDFGLVVDSSVIMVENCARRLGQEGDRRSKLDIVRDAAIEVRKPTMFGELIIAIVYLPILTLEGIEGKLFRPMAFTVILALLGSMVLSLTLMPVLASLFLSRKVQHRDSLLVRATKWVYRPIVRLAIRLRPVVIVGAIILLVGGAWIGTRLGAEFIPRLSEGAIAINSIRLAGVSLEESVRYGTQIERVLLEEFPDEIRDVWTRVGSAQVPTDPMGIELSDIYIMLHPREAWTRAHAQEELVAEIDATLSVLPGMRIVFTQPIEMRVNEMIAGIRTDLGIKIFGDDLEVLRGKAAEVEAILEATAGAANVYVEQITGQPVVEVRVDQDAVARYGVPARHVMEIVEAVGGTVIGEIREEQRRFDLVVRLPDEFRRDPAALGAVLIPTAAGERIPMRQLARISQFDGPSTITREWQRRRIVVQCNVRDRDVASFVEEVRERIDDGIELPAGYSIAFGGQFEHLERARARLMFIVPLALGLILLLLQTSTNSLRDALIIFTGAPFATLGGILALWLRDMPFTISAGVGFVAVSGVAMLNGLVMVSMIQALRNEGTPLHDAIERSALVRLRPVLMTALVASFGFIPMAFNTHVGAEVQRPLATVVIGGVVSDTLLTLLVLPALYATFGRQRVAAEKPATVGVASLTPP
ncbi:MAG: efflux RND transporter permease subunit [Phycisphaerales bacterium]|nr:CusA/CzcA family heavy metal efflux RND transporter [Phycisphaerae bacterium]NNF41987.1 efflux RND transporter permease subunit [Phycisphaerales bacterium]NNM27228.1 efflux RND transporter permease subunit [Phycisphaerales bacterium]